MYIYIYIQSSLRQSVRPCIVTVVFFTKCGSEVQCGAVCCSNVLQWVVPAIQFQAVRASTHAAIFFHSCLPFAFFSWRHRKCRSIPPERPRQKAWEKSPILSQKSLIVSQRSPVFSSQSHTTLTHNTGDTNGMREQNSEGEQERTCGRESRGQRKRERESEQTRASKSSARAKERASQWCTRCSRKS